jgi:molybdopterin-guanine dinucleotide biosynthesis protein A
MGQSKAWLPFGAEYMLPRVVRIVREAVDAVVVVAAVGQDLPDLPRNVKIVRDDNEGRGPLQGLATGLMALKDWTDHVYLSSCDVPLLRSAFIRKVTAQIGGHQSGQVVQIAMPRVEERFHPLAAAYSTSLLPAIQQLLDANKLRLSALCELFPTRFLEPWEFADVDQELESLRNLNTPEEYEAALRLLQTNTPASSGS